MKPARIEDRFRALAEGRICADLFLNLRILIEIDDQDRLWMTDTWGGGSTVLHRDGSIAMMIDRSVTIDQFHGHEGGRILQRFHADPAVSPPQPDLEGGGHFVPDSAMKVVVEHAKTHRPDGTKFDDPGEHHIFDYENPPKPDEPFGGPPRP